MAKIKLAPLRKPEEPKPTRPLPPFKLEYVVINEDKRPLHKFSGVECFSLAEVADEPNLAIKSPAPFSNFDFDNSDEADIMLRIIEDLNLKCRVMKTDRGIHVWFRTPDGTGSPTKKRNALGLTQDIRGWDVNSLSTVKLNGKWREWIRDIPWEEVEEAPVWLKIVHGQKYKDEFDFPNMEEGSRNDALFRYSGVLQTRGFTKEQVRETLTLINDYVLKDPLPKDELETILRDEAFFEAGQAAVISEFFDGKKFLHWKFAEALLEGLKVVTYHGVIYTYRNGYYQNRERSIEREMRAMYRACNIRQQNEVKRYIQDVTTIDPEDIVIQREVVNVLNGRVNLLTGELLPHTPDIIEFSQLPVYYDPLAPTHDLLERTLMNVFQQDQELFNLFEEMVGYLLAKHALYHKAFVLFGSGRNGKSTILDVLKAFLGEENYSSVELASLNDRFKTAELEHKLANIGDDIGDKPIKDTAILKKLISGDSITVERKNQNPFTLKNYAKLIFATNNIPKVWDTSFGMAERLILIPFNAKFTRDDPNYDPKIKEKLTTPEALTHLLNMALRGYRRLVHQKGFTKPKAVEELLDEYFSELTPVRRWIKDEGLEVEDFIDQPASEMYSKFKGWTNLTGEGDKISQRIFNSEVKNLFSLRVEPMWKNGKTQRCFVNEV
jgi:putative DNA primase/helicase